ncbi:hypothetical protein PAMP_014436 [Pampus punctatissimus]
MREKMREETDSFSAVRHERCAAINHLRDTGIQSYWIDIAKGERAHKLYR